MYKQHANRVLAALVEEDDGVQTIILWIYIYICICMCTYIYAHAHMYM